jgi:hypothetical protein
VFGNMILRTIFEPKGDEIIGGIKNYTVRGAS